MPPARQTAKKCRVEDVVSGKYVVQEGWEPNFVVTRFGNISRANIIATVVSVAQGTVSIDDGSATVHLRSFDNTPVNADVGQIVQVIGRPREFNGQRFVVPEIVAPLENPIWLELRRRELELAPVIEHAKDDEESPAEKDDRPVEKVSSKKVPITPDDVIEFVKENDGGDGVPVEEIEKKLTVDDSILTRLVAEGELYEIKPGVVKVLE